MKIISRKIDRAAVAEYLKEFPVTAIIGPRQSGKTLLAQTFDFNHYFDLENPRDIKRLQQPQLALEDLEGLIVIDEIQRAPELFPLIRFLVDNNKKQKYLILGSASGVLMKQTSESLAGRIAYFILGGFRLFDIGTQNVKRLWLRGGFPRAYLAKTEKDSFLWLANYITTFLERDIPQLGVAIAANKLRRFWMMLSHYHGQIVNYSELGRSFGASDVTIRNYIDILEKTFMVRLLQPWYANVGKRLVKRPKLYLKDSGIFHSLMSIETRQQLLSHNKLGASWEGFALECVSRALGKKEEEQFFWSTHAGAEMDLFWQSKGKCWGVEFKYSDAPELTKSMKMALHDLKLTHLWIVYPGKKSYKLTRNVTVLPLCFVAKEWSYP